MHKPKLV